MQAIIATSGRQFCVTQGETIRIDFQDIQPGETLTFDQVLLVSDGQGDVTVGMPTVAGAVVTASVIGPVREKKIHVGVFKRRKNFRKHKGHRQSMTAVRIESIRHGEKVWEAPKIVPYQAPQAEPAAAT